MTGSRRLAAILAADIAGYSRLMGADEEGTVRALKSHQAVILPMISEAGGRVIDTAGDGVLAEFASVLAAVTCALQIQKTMKGRNEGTPAEISMSFRMGVHLGDIIFDQARIYGDGINVASRLQALAEPGGLCISGGVHDELRGRVEVMFEDLGERELKNIVRPVRAYALQAREISRATRASPIIPASAEQPSLAVLPFNNMSGDPEQEYFADGITEDIITALSRAKWFSVIARNSSFVYKGKAVDIRQVGRELGVRYVLEGSVRKSGNRLRITGQLIEAENGRHVWADKYDGELAEVFDLQDKITESVSAAIWPSLQKAEVARVKSRPASLKAYDYYLRALPDTLPIGKAQSNSALNNLRSAIQADPEYADAKAYLALTQSFRVSQSWATEDDVREGVSAGDEALASAPDNPMVLALAGFTIGFLAGRINEALAATERAFALAPHAAVVISCGGWINYYAGNWNLAIDRFNRAIKLSPLDPARVAITAGLSFTLFAAGRYAEGAEVGRRVVAEAPTYAGGYRALAMNLARLGRIDDAKVAIGRLLALNPSMSVRTLHRNPLRQSEWDDYVDALRIAGLPE